MRDPRKPARTIEQILDDIRKRAAGELIDYSRAGYKPLPQPPKDAPTPPKPHSEVEREPGEDREP
jgi:hypothetical protein